MAVDITPEAVELLAHCCDGLGYRECATTLRALSAALTASQAETAAAYELVAAKLSANIPPSLAAYVQQSILALTPADSKAALDRMIAEAEERGRNIGVATEKLGRLVEWLKEDEYNVFLLPADDVEKMRAILAAIPKGKDHE